MFLTVVGCLGLNTSVKSKHTGESKLSPRNLDLGHHDKHPSKLRSSRNIEIQQFQIGLPDAYGLMV